MFLTGETLSASVQKILGGNRVRCAVAFWGLGAAAFMKSAGTDMASTKILCDLSMGGCWPGALRDLGAPTNGALRRRDGLHAKVYISDRGMVVGSPNASANGIGFPDCMPTWLEAGTFHKSGSAAWKQAVTWFDAEFDAASSVDRDALEYAELNWRPSLDVRAPRHGSLFDLVCAHPGDFKTLGFVFTNRESEQKDRTQARKNLCKKLGKRKAEIDSLPDSGIFSGWNPDELSRWPSTFIEFWLPKPGKMKIYGRKVLYFEHDAGAVFTKNDWRSVKRFLPDGCSDKKDIQSNDVILAGQLMKNVEGGVLFSNAHDLAQALFALTPYA